MGLRLFVVVAVLLIGVLLNATLIFYESVPEPVVSAKEFKAEDKLKEIKWTRGERRNNLVAIGLPSKMVDEVLSRMERIEKVDRNGDLIKTMKAAADVGSGLCSNEGKVPSRYAAVGMLLKGERGTRREVIPFERVKNRLAYQEGYRPTDMQSLYKSTELIPNAPTDAYALNIAALLLGEDTERIEQLDKWQDPVFGSLSIISFLNSNQEVELDMIEFFASMHYLHEVARDRKNEFCGVRTGVSTGGGG
jgi:hypothetical protein